LHLVDDVFGMLGTRALQQENGRFVVRAAEVLKRKKWNEEASALSVFHDSSDVPVVIQEIESVADFYVFRLGGEVVHKANRQGLPCPCRKERQSRRNSVELSRSIP